MRATKLQEVCSRLFAELHGYPLEDWIADQRDQGNSWRTIARNLSETTAGAIDVTFVTLQSWHRNDEAAA